MLVRKGSLRIYMVSEEGREVTLYRLFPGDVCVLSAACLMEELDFDILIEAPEDSEVVTIPAAANYADGRLTGRKNWYGKIIFVIIRFIYIITRSVPELVWGMLFIFFIQAGVLPGALALAVHNFGVLGRLCAEVVEDVNVKPLQSLARCGASNSQILMYGVFPMCFKKFLYYMMFRFEVIVRSTIVVGAVGAGGLGLYFKLRMSAMDYTGVTLVIMCYLIVVYLTDIVSGKLQKMWNC